MTKRYPKKHLLGQKIESWKGLLIFAFLNSSSSHKRENEKLCVLKCSKKASSSTTIRSAPACKRPVPCHSQLAQPCLLSPLQFPPFSPYLQIKKKHFVVQYQPQEQMLLCLLATAQAGDVCASPRQAESTGEQKESSESPSRLSENHRIKDFGKAL